LMWLAWFKWVNAGELIRKEQISSRGKWKFIYRKNWANLHKAALTISILLVLSAFANILLDEDAMAARETAEMCEFYSSVQGDCLEAKGAWAKEIDTSWSLATLGLLGFACTIIAIDKPAKKSVKSGFGALLGQLSDEEE